MSCYLCKSDKFSKRTGSVRDNPDIDILECSDCGLVYLSSLEHIQDGHYEESGMHDYEVPDIEYCIEVPYNEKRNKLWCPTNSGEKFTGALTSISFALANSMNNITASIIKKGSMINDVFNRVAQW